MKKKMRRAIFLPTIGVLTAFLVGGNIVANYFSGTLDWYFGQGEIVSSDMNLYECDLERTTDGKKEAGLRSSVVCEKVTDEGEILLKNDGVLPLTKGEKVTPVGFAYVDPVYKGVGSGALGTLRSDLLAKPSDVLNQYFTVNETVNGKMSKALKKEQFCYLTADGYVSKSDETTYVASTYLKDFQDLDAIYSADDIGDYKTGIVFLSRNGGENNDLQTTPYSDGTKHQLALTSKEKKMIEFAKANFNKIVIILNSSPLIDLSELVNDEKINAILWVGTAGTRGFASMGKILTGEVNPSGRLVDTYAYDPFSAPAMKNFGDFTYDYKNVKYLEYEEGIYVGYKYYETADELGYIEYENSVIYPFGYGLHYENEKITQTLSNVELNGDDVIIKGFIENNSSLDVKETVQIYFNSEYHSESRIEKAHKNLVAFDKYDVASKGKTEFTLSIPREDLASYDYRGYYNEEGCYVLESGDYHFYLGKNAHDSWGEKTLNQAETRVYADSAKSGTAIGKRPSDKITAKNLFSDVSSYMEATSSNHPSDLETDDYCTNLSRENFVSTYPTPTDHKHMPEHARNQWDSWTINSDLLYKGEIEELHGTAEPTSNASNGLVLSDLRGLDFDDPLWDKLLDQLDYTSTVIDDHITQGLYAFSGLSAIGQTNTTDTDGPQGITLGKYANVYCGEMVLASSWDKGLAKEMGEALGTELYTSSYGKIYGPAMNIHRTAFSGRNYEYFSEDGVLSGLIAAAEVSGIVSKGAIPTIKHFAINDQELNRGKVNTYVNEQAMRELYYKPFEIVIKQAECTINYMKDGAVLQKKITGSLGMMVSMNCIGSTYVGVSRPLLYDMVQQEWGFHGSITTDTLQSGDVDIACPDLGVAAGINQYLNASKKTLTYRNEAFMKWAMRDAIHNSAYAAANSMMTNVATGTVATQAIAPWRNVQNALSLSLLLIDIGLLGFEVTSEILERKRKETK